MGKDIQPSWKTMQPHEIEQLSFSIIQQELGDCSFLEGQEPVVLRAIHASADFSYASSLIFSKGVVAAALDALRAGTPIITDTKMALAGINKRVAGTLGCETICLVDDPECTAYAKQHGTTRSLAATAKASTLYPEGIYIVGNAPTALLQLCSLIGQEKLSPAFVVGAPVGFVNVVESKQRLMETPVHSITASGRKGGSNIAAAICNALLYEAAKPLQ